MKVITTILISLLLVACSKTTDTIPLSSAVQDCIDNDKNPMLVALREQSKNDRGAKYALQETCKELVKETGNK